jgi:hypothetical protein
MCSASAALPPFPHVNMTPPQTAASDEYGDFKFRGLEGNSGSYTLRFHSVDHGDFEITTELTQSSYLGTLTLSTDAE